MPGPTIKICGISSADALEATVSARADFVGLNFFPPSPRYVDLRLAAELGARAAGRIARKAVEAASLDAIQLHGKETPERAAQLKARFGLPVWKVLSVAGAADIARADSYRDAADFILFDAKTPEGTLPGGMGLSFDWALLAAYRGPLPWGLAGGLTPGNVAEAARLTGAPMVDTSSGVERATGVKDVDKIAAFCKAARL
jgi:phosphoribosylanthranilate isomerase